MGATTERLPFAESFGRVADVYDRARPDYPEQAVDAVLAGLGLGATAEVVDLAAGTGRLTRPLVARVGRVTAVEPLAEMRRVFRLRVPGVRVLDGSASAIPLANGSVDAVLIGEAFHWFHDPASIAEIQRVLRSGGGLGLVWNSINLREGHAPLQPIRPLFEPYVDERSNSQVQHSFEWRRDLEASGRFAPLHEASFGHIETMTRRGVRDLVESISGIARLDDEERTRVLDAVEAKLREGGVERVDLAYRTDVYWTSRTSR